MSYGLLTEEQAKIMRERYYEQQGIKKVVWPSSGDTGTVKCLHDACPNCGGTGVRKDGTGLCFHGISCPCPKCSFTC